MQKLWSKMPSIQNPLITFIAGKINTPRPNVISVLAAAAEFSQEENKKYRDIQELIELIAYCSGLEISNVQEIFTALQGRGLIDEKGDIVGIEKSSSNTERVRKWREKQRNVTGNVTCNDDETLQETYEKERPDQKDQKERPDQTRTSVREGSGSFASRSLGGLVGSGRRFDIADHLDGDDFLIFRDYCPQWDRRAVMEKYNSFVASDPPKNPKAGFLAWVKKNSNWLGRQP